MNVRGRYGGRFRGLALAVVGLALLASAAIATARSLTGADLPLRPGSARSCMGKLATIPSVPGDKLVGGPQSDVIVGSAGIDRISGGGGDDLICAGPGNDVISAGTGDDKISGGAGNDLLRGGESRDQIWGRAGQDRLFGEGGDDLLAGGANADRCDGGAGINTLTNCEDAPSKDDVPTESTKVPTVKTNSPPSAIDDKATVEENAAAASIPVLANDTDLDAGPKVIESVSQPTHGVVAITDGGIDLTYQPEPDYCNDGETADNFIYSLNGGSSATVSVTVSCVTEISASQGGLSPGFDPSVPDYTIRCDGSPLELSGRLAEGSDIAVDGEQSQMGAFSSVVPLEANQEFSFEIGGDQGQNAYHVRCLPADFAAWEYERLLPPSHNFYLVTPTLGAGAGRYAVIFDDHGVPVWWYTENPAAPSDGKVLPDGTIAWWSSTAPHGDDYEVRELDGTLVKSFFAATGRTDSHDFQLEPNGNFLVLSYQPREHVDLTAFGGGADDTVTDAVIEELTPDNESIWSWSTHGHIGLEETGRWWPTALVSPARDVVHINAVEPDGEDAFLISLRHTDAVYKIDKTTGDVMWKLGGTWTPKSLIVKGDPEGAYPLGGQHDVRLQSDGTITIHDNRTNLPGPSRAVRYQIDEANKTATLVEEVTDPDVPSSFCCGSARRSADGSWLMSWGGRSLVTEFNSAHQRTFRLGFGGVAFSYRAVPAPDGVLSATALRAGMDSMHPRP